MFWCTSTNKRMSTKQKWLIVSTEMQCRAIENNGGFVIQVPYRYYDIIITARNEVGARLYFHRHLSFCQWGGAIPACIAGGIPACLAAGLQGGLLRGGVPGPRGVCSSDGLLQGGLLLGVAFCCGVLLCPPGLVAFWLKAALW